MIELPEGGKAWFVRVRSRRGYQINPCSAEGWAMTAAYCAAVLALTPLVLHPTTAKTIAYVALLAGISAVFFTMVWRMSAPMPDQDR